MAEGKPCRGTYRMLPTPGKLGGPGAVAERRSSMMSPASLLDHLYPDVATANSNARIMPKNAGRPGVERCTYRSRNPAQRACEYAKENRCGVWHRSRSGWKLWTRLGDNSHQEGEDPSRDCLKDASLQRKTISSRQTGTAWPVKNQTPAY